MEENENLGEEEEENLEEEEDDDVDEFPDLAVSQTQQSQLPDHLLDDINRNEEPIEERNDATDHQIEGNVHNDQTEACFTSKNSVENTIQYVESAPGGSERLDETENVSEDISEVDQHLSKDTTDENTEASLIYWAQAAPDLVEVVKGTTIQLVPDIVSVARSSGLSVTSPLGTGTHNPGAQCPITPLFPYTVESQMTVPSLVKRQSIFKLDSVAGTGTGTRTESSQSNDLLDITRLTGSPSSDFQFTPLMNIYSEDRSENHSQGQFNSSQGAQHADEGNVTHLELERTELESSKSAAVSLKDIALTISSSSVIIGSGSISVSAPVSAPAPARANVPAFSTAGKVLVVINTLEANYLNASSVPILSLIFSIIFCTPHRYGFDQR